jgi:hypothetical protein
VAGDCPEWEYDKIPDARQKIAERARVEAKPIFDRGYPTAERAADTRKTHRALFKGLTPPRHPQYAGEYRGGASECLDTYRVLIRLDPLVGRPPEEVATAMAELADFVKEGTGHPR